MGDMYSIASRDVDVYLEVSEHWKQHHEEAMACSDLEEVIARGLVVFDLISHVDEWWHIQVFKSPNEYNAVTHQQILGLYQKWAIPCPAVLNSIDKFTSMGFAVSKAEEFRKRCREAKAVCEADDTEEVPDAIVKLRDEAVEDFRKGRTHEYRTT